MTRLSPSRSSLLSMRSAGASNSDIARRYGVSLWTVSEWVRRAGIADQRKNWRGKLPQTLACRPQQGGVEAGVL